MPDDATPPLPSSTMVPALLRLVNSAGGFATVIHKGSEWGSALLLLHRHGAEIRAYERLPALSEGPIWRQAASGEEETRVFVERQRRFDPDLWVLELDIADPARFVPGIPPLS